MKNKPQRERPALRSRSSYSRKGKRPYLYPAWVTDKRLPIPERIISGAEYVMPGHRVTIE